ncbi:SIP domain-containing protein [Micromonospora sp. NPDC047670]|uniref:SIP domain-containing protein n=1 Tax=Micromonospora sp. NPDC047670 TaxID=3364252 RepID=UPI00371E2B93
MRARCPALSKHRGGPCRGSRAHRAGAVAMVITVRRHLCAERGIAKERVYFGGYWKVSAH